MISRIVATLFVVFVVATCHAFDIKYVPFDEAIKSGQLVFIGFVENVAVTNRITGKIEAMANVRVEECLAGEICKKLDMVSIKFYAQISEGTSLPVNFPVGKQILLVLKSEKQGAVYNFDADVINGTDFGYDCDAFPYSILDVHSKFKCKDLITGREFKDLTINEIRKILHGM